MKTKLNSVQKELILGSIKYFEHAATNPYGNLDADDIEYCIQRAEGERAKLG